MSYYYWQKQDLFINVYVQPRAKRNAVVGLHNGRLKIQVKAPPVDAKANQELLAFLAEYLCIAPSKMLITRGQCSRNKVVCVPHVIADLQAAIMVKLKMIAE